MTKHYILVNDYQYLCDPCSYDEAIDMLAKDYDNHKSISVVEYVAPVRNNIDYSVLDQY